MRAWWLLCLGLFFSVSGLTLTKSENQQIQRVTQVYGQRAGLRVTAWRNLIAETSLHSEEDKLEQVNLFFNQLYFVDDSKLWGQKDYWATPLEFLGSNAGDCEDFSIAKYFTLRELGIEDSKLRLVYVKAIELNQFHMVVAYYPTPTSEPVLLDNLDGEIKKASRRKDLLPIYSFNGNRLWLMKGRGQGTLAGKSSRLSLWNDLRQRSSTNKLNKPINDYDG